MNSRPASDPARTARHLARATAGIFVFAVFQWGPDVVFAGGLPDETVIDSAFVEGQVVVVPAIGPGQTPVQSPPIDGSGPMPNQPATDPPGTDPPGTAEKSDPTSQSNVRRPAADKYVPQPIDQEIRKNPEGKVAFNIKGQPWEPVLQWLADASALSLDWQELPGDSLNLITTREYSLEEARDLINRHLLSRGFTMIVNGEVMSVVKTKELNSAMVPRVNPEMLKSLPDHTICKVSFDLDWLIADEAVEELKPMLSSAGQIHKLSRTNRLEVIDTAISLRQLWELIESEQSDDGQEQLVRAFRLQNRRADDVIRMLRDLLKLQEPGGSGSSEEAASMDPNMAMQMMQQVQQMQQQMAQAAAQPGMSPGGAKAKIETRLVLNQKENMILAQAAPDQMAVIEKAIEQIDVAGNRQGALLQNINRMKIYRLESVDPQTLTDLLQQLGDLDPATVLKVDRKKRSIIAWATLADHLTITTLVDKLDQSSRKIEVIPLRRLDAEYVAGTIRLLMGKEEEKEQDPFSRRYNYFDFGMMNQEQETAKEPSFKVEADTENNRLLVNANTIEMDEIRDLLMKLGELPDPRDTADAVRVFDLNSDEDLPQFRRQIERYWQRGNPVEFDLPDHPEGQPETPAPPSQEGQNQDSAVHGDNTLPSTTTMNGQPDGSRVRIWSRKTANRQTVPGDALTQMLDAVDRESVRREEYAAQSGSQVIARPGSDQTMVERSAVLTVLDETPPVKISLTPDGKLIVSSSDPQALTEMESLISQVVAPRRSFKVFRLKYATPSWVTLNLKDFFKAEEETKSTLEYSPYWGIMPSEKKVKGNRTLSKRRQPQFISDNFTSTILVRDADAKQLQTIEDLIAIYDVPEPSDSRSMRVTTIFRLQNARAASVAAAVKDVFRDLLSSNDKALEKDDKSGQRQGSGGLVTFLPGGEKKDGADEEEPIRFKGLLSIGIDDSSNTLIVSSAGSLMDTIGEMIEALDKAADSASVVQVVKVDKSVDLALIQERLRELMKVSQPQMQQPAVPPGPGQPVAPAVPPVPETAVE